MATVEDKLRSLVEGLYLRSTSGDINWSSFSNTDSYMSTVSGNTIEIDSSINENGEKLISVSIYNADGKVVESFNDEYFAKKLEPQNVAAQNYFSLMSNLYETARRSANGADKVLDDILSKLNAPKIDSDDVPF